MKFATEFENKKQVSENEQKSNQEEMLQKAEFLLNDCMYFGKNFVNLLFRYAIVCLRWVVRGTIEVERDFAFGEKSLFGWLWWGFQ